jgi:pyrroloquinoline quinone biosynthesis protein D
MPPMHTLDAMSVAERRRETRVRKYRGKLFVANAADAFELDEIAEFIFRQADGTQTVQQIGERLAAAYDLPLAQAMADTARVLAELAEHTVLAVDR